MLVVRVNDSYYFSVSTTETPLDEALPMVEASLTVGGLTAQSWQITVWVLVAAIFGGMLLAVLVAAFECKSTPRVVQ